MADNEDTTIQGETPDPQPPEGETQEANEQLETQEDEFDKDRAMTTIKTLRAKEKQGKKDAKALKVLQDAEDTRKKSEMDETERLKADLKESETKRAALTASRQRDRVRFAVASEARKQKVIEGAVGDVYGLVDYDSLEFDENGQPVGIDKVVTDVLSSRKHMTQAHTGARTDNDADNGTGGAPTGGFTDSELKVIAANNGVTIDNIKLGLAEQEKIRS